MADDARLIIELEARMDKLTAQLGKANQSLYAFSANAEKHALRASTALNKIGGGANWSKAFDKAFDSSRLTILNAGALRLRAFGSALEPLGALGIGAAAGVAAFGVAATAAIGQAKAAADWAEELQRASKTLGLSTTALQEFDFVAKAAGIPVEALRSSLSGLNEKIGQVQSGVALSRTRKIFEALGVSPKQLRDLGDLQHILPVILDKLAKVPTSERAGLAQRLDVNPEVLTSLIEARGNLSSLIDEAHRFGIVMDESVVARSAEAAEKMRVAAEVAKDELMVAFASLAPTMASASEGFAHLVKGLADFIGEVGYALEPIGVLIGKVGELGQALGTFKSLGSLIDDNFTHLGLLGEQIHVMAAIGRRDELKQGISALLSGNLDKNSLAALKAASAPSPPVTQLIPDKTKKARAAHGPRDDTEERLKGAEDALENAHRELAEAEKALTEDVRARGALEAEAVNAEAAKQTSDLKKQRADLLKDKGIEGKDSDVAQAKIEQAIADVEAARIAKLQELARKAAFAIEDTQIEVHKALFDAQIAELQAQADISSNLTERRRIEAEILRLKQQEQQDLEGTKIDRRVVLGELSAQQGLELKGALTGTQGAESQVFAQKQFEAANPLAAFAQHGQEEFGNLDQDFQKGLVKGMESFNASVAQAIENGAKFKDVWVAALKSLETELIEGLLQKLESSLILSFFGLLGMPGMGAGAGGFAFGMTPAGMGAGIGGFAGGGRISGPGTGSSDSMLARVSDGEFIVNADATRKALPLLSAINSGHWPKYAAGGLIGASAGTHISSLRAPPADGAGGPTFDLRGAVMTTDLVKQMNDIGRFYGNRAEARAGAAAKAALPGAQRQLRMLTG